MPAHDSPEPPALHARGLTKRYGEVVALDLLDLSVAAGEAVCLLGANGAGKTTTLNLFLGLAGVHHRISAARASPGPGWPCSPSNFVGARPWPPSPTRAESFLSRPVM